MTKPPAEAILSIAVIVQFVLVWVLARRLSDMRERLERARTAEDKPRAEPREA